MTDEEFNEIMDRWYGRSNDCRFVSNQIAALKAESEYLSPTPVANELAALRAEIELLRIDLRHCQEELKRLKTGTVGGSCE